MCHAVKCRKCGKTTWAGCGRHVEQVRRSVKASDWCPGHEREPKQGGGGLFARLMGGGGRDRA